MHSEGIMSGELKHGPLALIDDKMPCIMVMLKDGVYAVSYMCVHVHVWCMLVHIHLHVRVHVHVHVHAN